jgi:hypothetical protein
MGRALRQVEAMPEAQAQVLLPGGELLGNEGQASLDDEV